VVSTDWVAYLARYHRENAGITESALTHASHPQVGSAYSWLAKSVPSRGSTATKATTIDIGCGSAPMQSELRSAEYLGFDTSWTELQGAVGLRRGPVVSASATQLPLGRNSADVVVISMSLMLLPLQRTLVEVARVLRPGGVFAAMVPALWPLRVTDLRALLALSYPLRGPGSMPHQLGRRVLARGLNKVGFTDLVFDRKRFGFPLRSDADINLAVSSLYTPGCTFSQLAEAKRRLSCLPDGVELPVPLLKVVASMS
jgi:SAM-dependent methyltransferase